MLRGGGYCCVSLIFFFQAEDGIRDYKVTGVQTCALPIYGSARPFRRLSSSVSRVHIQVPEQGGLRQRTQQLGGRKVAPRLTGALADRRIAAAWNLRADDAGRRGGSQQRRDQPELVCRGT